MASLGPVSAQQATGVPGLSVSAEYLSVWRRKPDNIQLLKPDDGNGSIFGGSTQSALFGTDDLDGSRGNGFRAGLDAVVMGQRFNFSGMAVWGMKSRARIAGLDSNFDQDPI